MLHVAKPVADIEHETAPATRIADGSPSTVFDSLGKLRSLTANVTLTSLDKEIEKLLQSLQRLKDLQQCLRTVAWIKHRLMNARVRGMLEIAQESASSDTPDNLIPFPGTEFSANLIYAASAVAQPRHSASQNHPLAAAVATQPIASDAAKFSENPNRIMPVAEQSAAPQNRPDELNP